MVQYLVKVWFWRNSELPEKDLRELILSEFKPILSDALENVEMENTDKW